MRRRKKPDWLMVLFVAIGLGVVVTGYAFDMGNSSRTVSATELSK
jgi:hypothetical protein